MFLKVIICFLLLETIGIDSTIQRRNLFDKINIAKKDKKKEVLLKKIEEEKEVSKVLWIIIGSSKEIGALKAKMNISDTDHYKITNAILNNKKLPIMNKLAKEHKKDYILYIRKIRFAAEDVTVRII